MESSHPSVHTTRSAGYLLRFMAVCLLFPLMSCDLFEPRTPEDPVVIRSTFDPPTEPAIVLANLSASVRELNEANYLRCLSDSLSSGPLTYLPTPEAASRYGILQSWDKSSERDYFLNIRSRLPAGASMSLILGTPTVESTTADSVALGVTYDLTVPTGQQALPDRGRGRSLFTLVLDRRTGFWSIRSWQDFSIDLNTSSWSDVKGAFSQ